MSKLRGSGGGGARRVDGLSMVHHPQLAFRVGIGRHWDRRQGSDMDMSRIRFSSTGMDKKTSK